jgi:aryl-alcohol dehydrogenase-like predicted oxidoreductase
MNKRILGKTGLVVSEIGVGSWQLGGPLVLDGKVDGHPELGRDYCVDLIRQCGDLGINFVDTAEQYGNGESERRVGEAIRGQRDKWIVSTKFGALVGPGGKRVQDASPARVPVSLEGSLKRLQTDYIDVYLYHVAPKLGEAEEVAKFLQKAKQKGMVRAVGISTSDFRQVKYLHSLDCLDVVQFPHSIVSAQKEIRLFIDMHNLGGVVRGTFAGGRLSGKYFHEAPEFSPDDIRAQRVDPAKAAADYGRFSVFEKLLTPERDMVDLALRYVLDEYSTSVVITGGKSIEDYEAALHATEIPSLTPEEREKAKQLAKSLV